MSTDSTHRGASSNPAARPSASHADNASVIFSPITFRHLTVSNRLFRSSISGTFDEYNGHGAHARLNWEEKFAAGGIGAIISSFVPVAVRGRILTRYAMIDHDDKIPFWREVARRIHNPRYGDCKYILQLSHSGRQQDIGGVENRHRRALSSTSRKDFFHGILCRAMTTDQVGETVQLFAEGARRAKEAGLDGVELHGANGYLITQFLSSAINDRTDKYGGSVEARAQFVLEIVRAIRGKVGPDFHLQMKINGADHNNWLYPWPFEKKGNTIKDTLTICKILEDNGRGVDAFHVSSGSTFPHPRNPPGTFPVDEAIDWYDGMLSSGVRTHFNYWIFRRPLLGKLFAKYWKWRCGPIIEGINRDLARAVKAAASVKVLVTGGFQHADAIADAIRSGDCDAVTMARPLIANNDLPKILRQQNGPDRECTYCNRCLLNDLENPLGCYELARYDGATFEERYEAMMRSVMSVFEPPSFPAPPVAPSDGGAKPAAAVATGVVA